MIKGIFLIAAGVFGFLSILLAALAAHLYASRLGVSQLADLGLAIALQLFHSIVLLALAAFNVQRIKLDILFNIAGIACIVGILLFSISIELANMFSLTHLKILAPVGGLAFMIAWVFIFAAGVQYALQSK